VVAEETAGKYVRQECWRGEKREGDRLVRGRSREQDLMNILRK